MSSIPTLQECVDSSLAALEQAEDQTAPEYERAFLRTLAVNLGLLKGELYRYGFERALQNLARSSEGEGLTTLAANYGIIRKPEVTTILDLSVVGNSAALLPRTSIWENPDTGIRYFQSEEVYPSSTGTNIEVTCELPGTDGNVEAGANLTLVTPQTGIWGVGNVLNAAVVGENEETDDELRLRLQDRLSTLGGGSNSADLRRWGQETPGVRRIYPYSGKYPWAWSLPGDRTLFVESTPGYGLGGIADAALLAAVRTRVTTDPVTGWTRQSLGSTDDTLHIVSCTVKSATIDVGELSVAAGSLARCQGAIRDAVDAFTASLRPFIPGLDAEAYRNDVATPVAFGREIQAVVAEYGGYVGSVKISFLSGQYLDVYPMQPGEIISATVRFS